MKHDKLCHSIWRNRASVRWSHVKSCVVKKAATSIAPKIWWGIVCALLMNWNGKFVMFANPATHRLCIHCITTTRNRFKWFWQSKPSVDKLSTSSPPLYDRLVLSQGAGSCLEFRKGNHDRCYALNHYWLNKWEWNRFHHFVVSATRYFA